MSPPAKHKPEITPMNNHNFHSTVACAVCLLLVESDRLDYLHCFLYILALQQTLCVSRFEKLESVDNGYQILEGSHLEDALFTWSQFTDGSVSETTVTQIQHELHYHSQRKDDLKSICNRLTVHHTALADQIAQLAGISTACRTELQRVMEQVHVDNSIVSVLNCIIVIRVYYAGCIYCRKWQNIGLLSVFSLILSYQYMGSVVCGSTSQWVNQSVGSLVSGVISQWVHQFLGPLLCGMTSQWVLYSVDPLVCGSTVSGITSLWVHCQWDHQSVGPLVSGITSQWVHQSVGSLVSGSVGPLVCGSTSLWGHQSVGSQVCGSTSQWIHQSVGPLVSGCTSQWIYQSVSPLVCGCTGLWVHQSVGPLVCGSTGLWVHLSVGPLVCGFTSLWCHQSGVTSVWVHQSVDKWRVHGMTDR